MESSHFLAISSPWQKVLNVLLRILICCHGNEIWAIFAKISICFFFFVFFRRNRAIFWPLVLREPLYKSLFFDFWFSPPKPQNWLPKTWTKIAYNSACMTDRPQMFAPNRKFSGMADWLEPYKMLWVDPCCHGNEIWAKVAYNSTCTADRPQMFRHSRGFSGVADSMQPCKILYGRPLLPWQRHLG